MFKKLISKLYHRFVEPIEVEESPPGDKVSFCAPFSDEDIFNESDSIDTFINNLKK